MGSRLHGVNSRDPFRNQFMRKRPVITLTVLAITAFTTGMQGMDSRVLSMLERTPNALANHEYWRLITPLFVHADGWRQIVFDFFAMAILGFMVEQIFGGKFWLSTYFVCGLVGELAGYAWQPLGAGSSVGSAGLLGAIATWLLIENRRVPAMFGAVVILGGAIVLSWLRDIHGPPVLAGASVALIALRCFPGIRGNIHASEQL